MRLFIVCECEIHRIEWMTVGWGGGGVIEGGNDDKRFDLLWWLTHAVSI